MKRAGELDPDRWRRVREVFDAALDVEIAARAALVGARCGEDELLRAEVMDLLEAEARLELEDTALGDTGGSAFLQSSFELLLLCTREEPEPGADTQTEAEPGASQADGPELPFRWGPLEVLEQIGAGSFGRVYRAHDATLRRDVALKLRHVDPQGRTQGGEGHLEEARRLARVRHPNVLVVHGAEIHDEWAGIWTDLVPGETLDLLLQRNGPFSRDALLHAGVDLCRALEAVHSAAIVHGDIKPSNAMRDADGRVLLMDFGSGMSTVGASGDEWAESSTARSLQGTPVAMAPELFGGAPATVASDLYALGVLLYRLASGQYPFQARGLRELQAQLQAQERIPLDELRPDLPSAFARVVHRALAPDPDARPGTATELQWLIAASLGAEEIEPRGEEPEAAESSLPKHATRFVGRASELRQLRSLLTEPGLVTVVGAGGCGKTRLAVRLAGELTKSLSGGAVWVDLVSVEEGGDVAAAAARAAGRRDEAGRSAREHLEQWIGQRSMLLVLDNAEHVREAAALLTRSLIRSCPRLHLLVTTRKRLGVEGERTFRLTPMALPAERGVSDGLEVLESDAVRLFLDRARRGGDDLRLTSGTAPDVARIVRRVEGIPLAIELAAARVSTLGLSAVAAKLDEGFRLLASRDPASAKRHATLWTSIAWSYELLEGSESRLFARLSVFAGGWSLAAAESVCADAESAVDDQAARAAIHATDVVDLLSGLVEHSLVSVESIGEEEPRYRLLEVVRAFAALRLEESGEAEAVFGRHADWIEREVRSRIPAIFGPEMHRHLAWFDREHGNVRSALRRMLALARAGITTTDRLLSACTYIRAYWNHRGHLREGLETIQEALRITAPEGRLRGMALTALAGLHRSLGDLDLALEATNEAATFARTTNNSRLLAGALSMLASVYTDRGDYARARAHFEEALAIREGLVGEDDPSVQHAAIIAVLANLGVLEASIGNLAEAQAWYERALVLAKQHRDDTAIGPVTANLALTLFERGQLEPARALAIESLRAIRRSSSLRSLWMGVRPMVLIEIKGGRLSEAAGYVLEGLSSLGEEPNLSAWIEMLETAADLFVARRQAGEATEVLGAIDAARERSSVPLPIGFRARWTDRQDRLRDLLGAESFGSAWARGRARSMADTVTFALAAV